MSKYTQPVDIVNRALQILELPRINSLSDVNPNAQEMSVLYDEVREELLRRHLWRYSTRKVALRACASTTLIIKPNAWAAGTYQTGSIVNYQDINYIAVTENATGTPGVSGSGWEQYFGPLTITPWNLPAPSQTTAPATDVNPYLPTNVIGVGNTQYGATAGNLGYFTGELVYIPKGDGTQMTFRATVTSAGTNPTSPTASPNGPAGPNQPNGPLAGDPWDAAVTYQNGDLVSWTYAAGPFISGITPGGVGAGALSGGLYQSTTDLNVGNAPGFVNLAAALTWNGGNAYSAGDLAWGSDNQVYLCLVPNTGNNPVTDTLFIAWLPLTMWVGTWTDTITPSPRAISNGWQLIANAPTVFKVVYPLTAGPVDDLNTLNAFHLPSNYVREAPENPKEGGIGYLGAPSGGNWYDDWVFEGDFIISNSQLPIIMRFVADITDVRAMDPLFRKALAAALAKAAQPTLQPGRNDLYQRALATYKDAIDEAQTVNGIEIGSTQPPVDEYIRCRL